MMMKKSLISNMSVAYYGAFLAIGTVFAYSILVMMYVVIRSSTAIYSIMPVEERGHILFANGFSVAYSVAVFSLLMATVSSIVGTTIALIMKALMINFNTLCKPVKAFFISLIVSLSTATVIYFLLRIILKDWMTYTHVEPFLFWLLLPAVLFITVCLKSGKELNKLLQMDSIAMTKGVH